MVEGNLPRNPDGTFAKRNNALGMSGDAPQAQGTQGRSPKVDDFNERMRSAGKSNHSLFEIDPG